MKLPKNITVIINGDIFESKCKALVNPVNTVGVMGKGLALQFKQNFPKNFIAYKKKCESTRFKEKLRAGWTFTYPEKKKLIINLATKEHWKNPSKIEYIKTGVRCLPVELKIREKYSIAIPKIGCGLGGLNWEEVKNIIINEFKNFPDIKVEIYE